MIQFTYSGTMEELERLLGGAGIKQEMAAMAKNIHDINAGVTELRAAIATEHAEVTAILEQQQASIDELKELVAASGTQEEIEAALASIQSAKDEVSAIVEGEEEEPTPGE